MTDHTTDDDLVTRIPAEQLDALPTEAPRLAQMVRSDQRERVVSDLRVHVVACGQMSVGVTTSIEDARTLVDRYLTMVWPNADRSREEIANYPAVEHRYYPCADHVEGVVDFKIQTEKPWTPDRDWPFDQRAKTRP